MLGSSVPRAVCMHEMACGCGLWARTCFLKHVSIPGHSVEVIAMSNQRKEDRDLRARGCVCVCVCVWRGCGRLTSRERD